MICYVVTGEKTPTALRLLLIWKSTEMPNETLRHRALEAFQHALEDAVDWKTAQYTLNEAIIHNITSVAILPQ